ncbi:DUF397 domain-containing protein [Streptomyces iranensis]|uniref:Regulatory protein n=1 Tax=Streptomyces iranensis TaxID=576784 RepID=A0A060ZMF8_9ACTN|nr:DUF397 domain-containing protein [Streptomyces iranensis]MBP2062501.1 hypothetical protein [Streptomyces iranensis]CDR07290.1 regulatory protein [Streptomyces iranensis]
MSDRISTVGVAAAVWRRSSYSGPEGNECVEVADLRTHIAVRDSKKADGPVLTFPADAFASFVSEVKAGLRRD